jgi:hypothetical protein
VRALLLGAIIGAITSCGSDPSSPTSPSTPNDRAGITIEGLTATVAAITSAADISPLTP